MSIERKNESVGFTRSLSTLPTLLCVGHRYQKGSQGRVSRIPAHYLFHLITSGSGTVFFPENREVKISAGDWFFCFPDQSISYQQDSSDLWEYYWIGFHGKQAETILAQAGIPGKTGIIKSKDFQADKGFCQAMYDELRASSLATCLKANTILLQLLTRFLETASDSDAQSQSPHPTIRQTHIDQACSFMINHFETGIRVEDVINHIGFERTYFTKIFSQQTGTTICNYLAKLRVKRAEELLARNSYTVTSISHAVGYEEPRTFSRFFKQQTGLSPKEWQSFNCDTG